jgi:hypothetical protein
MNKSDFLKLLLVSFVSIALGAATITFVYFVTTRQAPTAPPSKPSAANVCYLEFFFPSPTQQPSITPSATPTTTPPPGCGQPCVGAGTCSSGLTCAIPSGETSGFCAIPEFVTACQSATETNATTVCCVAPTSTPTLTPTVTPTNTPTVTPTSTPAPTSTPTPTPTIQTGCYSNCTSDSNCGGSMVCQSISGINRCVNSSCPYSSNCVCESPTSTPTLTPTTAPQTYVAQAPSPTPTQVVLLQAGVSTPTWTAVAGGAFMILLGVLFFAL